MNWLIPIISAFLYRIDGWGEGDNFLPFIKAKWGGLNYTRYVIVLVIALITHNWWYALTYGIATSIPYGEKHWWMKYGLVSWYLIGFIWGLASLDLAFALWLGFIVVIAKAYDIDHSLWEFFIMGGFGTIIHCFK